MTNVTTLTRACAWSAATVAALALTVTAHTLPPVVHLTTPTPMGGGGVITYRTPPSGPHANHAETSDP